MDYERKYKEALEKLQEALAPCKDGCKIFGLTRDCLENIFPELKESEDERIRKAIIAYIDHGQHNGVSNKDMIAWLEKQTEKKSMWTDNDRTMTFTLLRDVDQLTYISDEGKNERLQWLNSLEDKFNSVE